MISYELKACSCTENHGQSVPLVVDDAVGFSSSSHPDVRTWNVDYPCMSGCFTEYRYRNFDVIWNEIECSSDCMLETRHQGTSFLAIGAVLKGNVMCRQGNESRLWREGDSNAMVTSGSRVERNFFRKGDSFGMFDIVVSPDFMYGLACRYPDFFGAAMRKMERGETCFLSKENIALDCVSRRIIEDMRLCRTMGNCSEMFIEAKVLEYLSVFFGFLHGASGQFQPVSRTIRDKMLHARAILQEKYLDPPDLHALALEVGTNECTLKSAFKQVFGRTVFGFLFDYRMDLAAGYLTGTGMSVAEVAALTGYEYQSHFCTAFRRRFGVSPGEFRQRK